jgi:hypothetical protein
MKINLNKNGCLSTITPLSIAGITIWGFLLTYFTEVGILKYYKIPTRLIKLDIHIFAMSWRAFLFLISFAFLCYLVYLLFEKWSEKQPGKNIKFKNPGIHYLLLFLFNVFFPIVGYFWLMESFCYKIIMIYYFIIFVILTFYLWASSEHYKLWIFTILTIILFVYVGGMEISYSYGYNVVKNKDEYFIINDDSTSVVILENNEFILWSKYNHCSSTLDSSFKITYFSSDTSISLKLIELGPIKQK